MENLRSAFKSILSWSQSLLALRAWVPMDVRSILSTSAIIRFTSWASYKTGREVCDWNDKHNYPFDLLSDNFGSIFFLFDTEKPFILLNATCIMFLWSNNMLFARSRWLSFWVRSYIIQMIVCKELFWVAVLT